MNALTRLRHITLIALAVSVFTSTGRTEDLGNGLQYLRLGAATSLPRSIDGPVILDLRYLERDLPAEPLAALLQAEGPLRIVIYSRTPPARLADALAHRAPNVLTVAPSDAVPQADFELAVEPEEDRAAYEAYDQGVPVSVLTRTGANKLRHDEAALVRSNGSATRPPLPDEQEEVDPKAPVDRLLQRAEQLARGLQALNRAG